MNSIHYKINITIMIKEMINKIKMKKNHYKLKEI